MSFYVTVSLGHPPTPHTPARRLLTRSRTTAYHGTVRARPPPLTPPRATSHPAQRRGHVATIVSSPACLPHPSGRGGSASSLTPMRSGALRFPLPASARRQAHTPSAPLPPARPPRSQAGGSMCPREVLGRSNTRREAPGPGRAAPSPGGEIVDAHFYADAPLDTSEGSKSRNGRPAPASPPLDRVPGSPMHGWARV